MPPKTFRIQPYLIRHAIQMWVLAALCCSEGAWGASVILSELLTRNTSGLKDEDGQSSEWVELYNSSNSALSLSGWTLTDDPTLSRKWTFPATNLPPGGYLLVFATGKSRATPGLPLHTSFRLSNDPGYLALCQPSGKVESELAYPAQRRDVSFGPGREAVSAALIPPGATVRVLVPTDGSLGSSWTGSTTPFTETGWSTLSLPVGFDLTPRTSPGLLATWNFNSNAIPLRVPESSGKGHTGIIQGSAAYTADRGGRTGLAGDRAMNFGPSGNSARVSFPDATNGWFDATLIPDAITFSLWTYGDSSQPGQGSVFWGASGANGGGTRSAQAHLPWSDRVLYWDTAGAEQGTTRVSISMPDETLWKGRWNHYVLTKNKASKEIWINGKRVLQDSNPVALASIRSFAIGGMPDGGFSYGGLIDDFAIWSRALSSDEIQSLAAGGSPLDLGRIGGLIRSDISSLMRGINASVYLRIPFTLASLESIDHLALRLRSSDGFTAYLNGVEVARRRAPEIPSFDSVASGIGNAMEVEEMDLSPYASLLRVGANTLALHGMNNAALDDQFLLDVQLTAARSSGLRFFESPSPGAVNTAGSEGLVATPEVDRPRGYLNVPTPVTFRCETRGATLHYTLDGSVPSLSNGVHVPGTGLILNLSNTTLLRLSATKPGHIDSPTATHTYLFAGKIPTQSRPSYVGAAWPDGAPTDFEIDSRVVAGAMPNRSFQQALESIPTLSVVAPGIDIFGPAGIYANPSLRSLEIPASIEWIPTEGAEGFQEDAGVEIHGNITRDKGFTPKHSFNLLFRDRYGASQLRQPVFPDSAASRFDRLVLRAGSTDTWPTVNWDTFLVDGVQRWLRDEASYIRDQWVRDTQLSMGQASAHGTYVHLFLGGYYWGLYNLCERPDDAFSALYYGGAKEDYDVLADFAEVRSGDKQAWDQMNALAGRGLASDAAYQKIQGRNPDGSRNPAYPVLLDVTNLVDYMLLHIFIGADDWPNHNWWASRQRHADSTGFKFFAWDQEISINSVIRQQSSWGAFWAEADVPETPTYVYARCRANAEFRQLFADRIQKHLFNNGALSIQSNLARWDARMAEVDRAVVAESARWGDYRRPERPYTREVEWLSSNAWMRAVFFPSNHVIALKRYTSAGLYPKVGPPLLSQAAGIVTPGFRLALTHTNASGSILFTTDGSDPRLRGGSISPRSTVYSAPIEILQSIPLSARVRQGTNWSALVQGRFTPAQDFSKLELSEIMYHPEGPAGTDTDAFEFLEVHNAGAVPLDLTGLSFEEGIRFNFPTDFTLPAGGRAVLARDPTAFQRRYPDVALAGRYEGKLADGGEKVSLSAPGGGLVLAVDYSPKSPWPIAADGYGFSLVPDERSPGDWRASTARGGSPGRAEAIDPRPKVIVSEVFASALPGDVDFIELQNLSSQTASIGGWYLSDDPSIPAKFRIPAGTQLSPGGFWVVTSDAFSQPVASPQAFGLSSEGDEACLFSADDTGKLTGYSHQLSFEGSDIHQSQGRYLSTTGNELTLPCLAPTPGDTNSAPQIGPVLISEIHYHPFLNGVEFVELHNTSPTPVELFDPAHPTNTWVLRGLNYSLPRGLTLAGGERLVVAGSEPALFRASYPAMAANVRVIGPFPGQLQDSGERLELMRPRGQRTNGPIYFRVDTVRYNDRSPWSPAADGNGPSLQRITPYLPGEDPAGWLAASPSPGGEPGNDQPPRILVQPKSLRAAERSTIILEAVVQGSPPIFYQWFHNNEALPGATEPKLSLRSLSNDHAGEYQLSFYNLAGASLSIAAQVSVLPLPFIYSPPASRALNSNTVVSLTVAAAGTGPLRYQWFRNNLPVASATGSVLRLPSFNALQEGRYTVEVVDDVGSTTSPEAWVEILRRPSFVSLPVGSVVVQGDTVSLSATGSGSHPFTWRWRRAASLLLTESNYGNTSTLTLSNIQPAQAGAYSVSLSNTTGSTTNSASFQLQVLTDTDGDRLPDSWETANGLDPNKAADALLDIDHDGLTAREEYLAGTDPRDANSRIQWESVSALPHTIELSFLAVSNRTYQIHYRTSLTQGWAPLLQIPSTNRNILRRISDPLPETGERYYRIVLPP